MTQKPGVAKYYIVIGRHPKPKPKKPRSSLRVAGNPIGFEEDYEGDQKEFSAHHKHKYTSILDQSLCEKRSDARAIASYFERKGYPGVEICAVVPLKKFVREPRLVVEKPEE